MLINPGDVHSVSNRRPSVHGAHSNPTPTWKRLQRTSCPSIQKAKWDFTHARWNSYYWISEGHIGAQLLWMEGIPYSNKKCPQCIGQCFGEFFARGIHNGQQQTSQCTLPCWHHRWKTVHVSIWEEGISSWWAIRGIEIHLQLQNPWEFSWLLCTRRLCATGVLCRRRDRSREGQESRLRHYVWWMAMLVLFHSIQENQIDSGNVVICHLSLVLYH